MSAAHDVDAPSSSGLAKGRRGRWALEAGTVLLAPIVAFFALQLQGMAHVAMIDRFFYQAYTEHPGELMTRYGPGNYYWVRLGFLLPSRASYELFGAVPGFFVWRYVLALIAIVPAYLLLRRLSGVPAAWVAVAAILANPVLVYAWGTDYPDSSGVSYLVCGICCLLMPVTRRRARVLSLLVAGVALTLSAHSQAVSVPLIVVAVAGYALLTLDDGVRNLLRDLLVLIGAAAAVTALLAVTAWALYGHPNIVRPTLDAYFSLRSPDQQLMWHSTNWRWVLRDPYLLVPPTVCLALLAVTLRQPVPVAAGGGAPARTRWAARILARIHAAAAAHAEVVLAVIGLGQFAVFALWQFAFHGSGLEYHFYSSLLWPVTVLALACLVTRLASPLLRRARTAALPAVAVAAVPYLLSYLRNRVTFTWSVGVPLALLTIAIAAGGAARAGAARRRFPASPVGAAAVVTVVALTGLLTIGKAVHRPLLAGQWPFPQAAYGNALRAPSWRPTLDSYQLAARLNTRMPRAHSPGQTLMLWYADGDTVSSELTAQYLWQLNDLSPDLPHVSPVDLATLARRRPALLALVVRNPLTAAAAAASLRGAGLHTQVLDKFTLHAGRLTDRVVVLKLSHLPRPAA